MTRKNVQRENFYIQSISYVTAGFNMATQRVTLCINSLLYLFLLLRTLQSTCFTYLFVLPMEISLEELN